MGGLTFRLRILFAVGVAGLGVLSANCSESTPSVSEAESAVHGAITGPEANRFTILSFRKTDAIVREVEGVSLYTLEFEALIEAQDDAAYLMGRSTISVADPYARREAPSTFEGLFRMAFAPDSHALIYKGDTITLTGGVGFMKKESGWVVDTVSIENHAIDASRRADGHSPEELQRKREEIVRAQEAERRRREERVQQQLSVAQQHLEDGRYNEALAAVELAITEVPDNAQAQTLRARIQNTIEILGAR